MTTGFQKAGVSAPDVSVIVAAWKAADLVSAAVASALASVDVSVEVIVVDDASPDDTWTTLTNLAETDARIRIDRLAVNGGPSAARNRAIDLARGRYIAVLDSDDALTADRLARLSHIADETGADIVVDNMVEVDANDRQIGEGFFLRSAAFGAARDVDLATWVEFNQPLKSGDCLGYLKPLFRRDFLKRTDARYDPALRNSEDYYFVAHLLAAGARMKYDPAAGYRYRRAEGSTSHRLSPSHTRAWLTAEKAFFAQHGAALSASEKTRLATRLRGLQHVDQLVRTIDLVKTKRFAAAARLLVSSPGSASFTLASLARIAVGKATGRSAFTRSAAT